MSCSECMTPNGDVAVICYGDGTSAGTMSATYEFGPFGEPSGLRKKTLKKWNDEAGSQIGKN